jgi:hypothetical protein
MINNPTSIKKTNNYISPQLIEHNNRPRHMTLEVELMEYPNDLQCQNITTDHDI